jgi:hypothetical protein
LSERSWKRDPFSLLFRRRKIPKDIRQLIDAICIIDAARSGRFRRLTELRKIVEKIDLSKGTGFTWKTLKSDISAVLDLPRKDPKVARYASFIPAMSILILAGFFVLVTLFTLVIYAKVDFQKYSPMRFSDVVAIVLFVIGGFLVVRWYMEEKISEFYHANPTRSQRLGRFNQALIDHLAQRLKETKTRVNFQMRLLNTDYRGITVLKKPSIFRDWYVAKIDLKKGPDPRSSVHRTP